MDQNKKKRSENWSSEEKEILRQLIAQSAHIIENKSTKTSTNMCKISEWKIISTKFNELTGKCRSVTDLKLAWKRMKLSAKSNLSRHRQEQTKTGGGKKPQSPSSQDLEVMAIAPYDFIMEVNDYDSDAVIPVAIASNTVEVFADQTDPAIIVEEIDKQNPQHIVPATFDTTDTQGAKTTNNNETGATSTTKKRKNSLQNRSEEMRQSIVQSNKDFKERHLEMMEVEHQYNIKIAQLKIQKLELEIALLQSKHKTSDE